MRRQELHPRTAAINKVQKNQSKKIRNTALTWLVNTFPAAFDTSKHVRPLKIGIMTDILTYADEASKQGISKSKLREAVVLFTRRIDYLACLKAREMRVDLMGAPTTLVTEEEAEKAASKIKKRIEKSTRNARKLISTKTTTNSGRKLTLNASHQSEQEYNGHYPERAPAFSVQNPFMPPRSAAVVVKKSSRQFDPDAVARLKEKLGLSRKSEPEELSDNK